MRDALAPLVIVVRDPDASNDFHVFDGDVETHDIDLGYLSLDDAGEFAEWAEGQLTYARSVESARPAAAAFVREQVEQVRAHYDHPDPTGDPT